MLYDISNKFSLGTSTIPLTLLNSPLLYNLYLVVLILFALKLIMSKGLIKAYMFASSLDSFLCKDKDSTTLFLTSLLPSFIPTGLPIILLSQVDKFSIGSNRLPFEVIPIKLVLSNVLFEFSSIFCEAKNIFLESLKSGLTSSLLL